MNPDLQIPSFVAVPVLLQALYFVFVYFLWKKTRSLSLMLVQLCIFYYTFHIYFLGALTQVFKFTYYMPGYYKIENGPAFFLSWTYLLLSVHLYSLVFYWSVPKRKGTETLNVEAPKRPPVILITSAIVVFNIWLWRAPIFRYFSTGLVGYDVFKRGDASFGSYYPIIRLSLEFVGQALFFLLLPLLVLPKEERNAELKNYRSTFSYLLLFLVSFAFFAVMGDRVSLISGLLFSVALVIDQVKNFKPLVLGGSVVFIFINGIAYFRIRGLESQVYSWKAFLTLFSHIATTGEGIVSLSLYKVISHDVPLFLGGSLKFFFTSLVPRLLVPVRPTSAYDYYTSHTQLDASMGLGLHYFADWYMNFGLVGILTGGVLLGAFHGWLYRLSLKNVAGRFLFSGMVGALPLFLRSPLDFKGVGYSMVLAYCLYFISYRDLKFKR